MELKIQYNITLILLLLLPSCISISISPSQSPSRSPSPSPLDPKQARALRFLGLSSRDPCANPSPHNNSTSCDSSHPFRHILSLTLSNCSSSSFPSLSISLRSFSSLSSLSFIDCPIPPPRHLPSSLRSFSSNSSLRHLSSLLLSRLHNLTSLSILSVPISGSGLPLILSDMPHLLSLTISHSNLSGPLPSILSSLPLTHLDLSSNNLNGTLPTFSSSIHLQYLNLENNNFHGVIPYNSSFINRLQVFKVSGNANLCYNHSLLSSKLSLGIAKCDQYGLPISPPPAADSPSKSNPSDESLDDENDGGLKSDGSHHGGGPNKLVLGVAITLSFLVFLVIFLLCISKACGCR